MIPLDLRRLRLGGVPVTAAALIACIPTDGFTSRDGGAAPVAADAEAGGADAAFAADGEAAGTDAPPDIPVETGPDAALDADDAEVSPPASDGGNGSAAQYAGRWAGQTSQGQAIHFVVDGYGVDEWDFGWVLPMCASTTTTMFAAPVPIVGGQLDRTEPAGAGGMTIAMHIAFGSNTTAAGSIHFTLHAIPGVPSCSGDAMVAFTASEQPP